MALQEIQFLDRNYLVEGGSRLSGGSRPRVSPMLGGGTEPALTDEFLSTSISNLDGKSGSFGSQKFQFAGARTPDNALFFVQRQSDNTDNFGDFYFAPTTSHSQSNFANTKVYKLHEVGEQIITDSFGSSTVKLYYFHLPDEVSSQTWILVRASSVRNGQFFLYDSFIGESVKVRSTISAGLSYELTDPSLFFYADSGRGYSVRKPKFYRISSVNLPFISRNQRSAMLKFFEKKGITEPFWVALDPDDHWDGPRFGASFGAYRFEAAPKFTHNFLDKFSVSFALREAL